MMTMAVATNAVLAEANSGLIQAAVYNSVEQQDSINHVGPLSIAGASGNIGVNMAAGVGNQQLNSLTIATSSGGVAAALDADSRRRQRRRRRSQLSTKIGEEAVCSLSCFLPVIFSLFGAVRYS